MVILLFIGNSAHSLAQSICSDSNLRSLVSSGIPAFSKNELTDRIENSKVTVVGEIHFYTDLNPRLDVIRQFNNFGRGKKCVAYEFANVEGHDFSDFMSRIKTKLEGLKDGSIQKQFPELSDDLIKQLVNSFGQIYDYYGPMSELTSSLGMKAVMVDHKDHNFETSRTMDERNVAMSENLESLISNGVCDSILFFVGKAHAAKNMDSTTRVQDLIKARDLSVVTINLQMTEETLPAAAKSWSICPILQSLKLTDYAFFKNVELERDYTLFPYMLNDRTKWKDFDFTLLAP